MTNIYQNRVDYINQLRWNDLPRLDIFIDELSVYLLVERQLRAENMARYADPGWWDAIKKSGIWDEDQDVEWPEELPPKDSESGHSASEYRIRTDMTTVGKQYR
jgi:hypothetical protein